MIDTKSPNSVDTDEKGAPLSYLDVLRNRLGTFRLYGKGLWKDIQDFGHWLESEASVIAKDLNQNTIQIELSSDGHVETLRIDSKKHSNELSHYKKLWEFLHLLGINRIVLDARLEKNQFEDVLVFLYSYRHKLINHQTEKVSQGILHELLNKNGVHLSCTCTSMEQDTLVISYSYCLTCFSRIVRWFEDRHKHFRDHRSLFGAAPRYAILVAVVAMGFGVIYFFSENRWVIFTVSIIEAVILFCLTYLFFMIVGSVEYDNEEKAYRLTLAYGKLKTYADRLRADSKRAQTVQERFIPDLSDMPFNEQIEWAGSFIPEDDVGGDYFDVRAIDEGRIAILFSDVCGHGMAAAFITAILKTTFQTCVDNKSTLSELACRLNNTLYRLTSVDSFAGVFVAFYNTRTGELQYLNGGHQPEPWLIPAEDNKDISSLSDARTLLMGVLEDIVPETSCLTLKPGDTVLFVSDGIVENQNSDGQQYGTERFEEFMRTRCRGSVKDMVRYIVDETETFSKGTSQSDDRTVLAFRIKNESAKPLS